MSNARQLTFDVLSRWKIAGDPPSVPERHHPQWAALPQRDRAFAFELLTGVLRWRGTLDAILATRLRQPIGELETGIRAALWLGAYQMLFQDTADYAAVDTAVELARQANPRAAGLVNAVLRALGRLEPRRVAADTPELAERLGRRVLALDFQTDLRFSADLFPDPVDRVAHLAAVRSHPPVFVRRLLEAQPSEASDILLRNNQRPLVCLRADGAVGEVPDGVIAHPTAAGFYVAAQGWSEALEQLVQSGSLAPQDPTAAAPVAHAARLVRDGALTTPRRVLDYCAGLGTKTVQLARAFPEARITATDVDRQKLARLSARVAQLGLSQVESPPLEEVQRAAAAAGEQGGERGGGAYDLVLVDVPCSNTGVFARRVQSRWRWPLLDHAALATLQNSLLERAGALLAPGGTMIYSTCSIDPMENQERVAAFLNRGSFDLRHEQLSLPSLASSAPHDGGYFALLTRR